jgi:AraC family transcriptional regulator, transcriptional activator of pobA
MERDKPQVHRVSDSRQEADVLNVPAYFLYGESWTRSIFGFFHIEPFFVRNIPNKWRISHHRHLDFDQISVLFKGKCTFEHDGQQRTIDGPSCVYTPANVVHQFIYSPGALGSVLSFSPDFATGLSSVEGATNAAALRLASARVVLLKSQPQISAMQGLVDLLTETSSSVHRNRRDELRYLFSCVLLELDAAVADHPDSNGVQAASTDADLFRRYRDLIHGTIGAIGFSDDSKPDTHTVETFAMRLSTTPYTLNVACQSVCGCPAREVIQNAILEQATRLLLYTTRPVKEISFLLGYSHASHFARFFKQRRGSSPEAFRNISASGTSTEPEPKAT